MLNRKIRLKDNNISGKNMKEMEDEKIKEGLIRKIKTKVLKDMQKVIIYDESDR